MDVAEDEEQARNMGSEVDSDLVILDLNLPRLDGVAVLRHLRLRRPSLPVLVLTLRSSVEDRAPCLDTGADDYLPVSYTHLAENQKPRPDAMPRAPRTMCRQLSMARCS